MSQSTGEDEIGLHRILGTVRGASALLLLLHFYFVSAPEPTANEAILRRLSDALAHLPGVSDPFAGKCFALLLLLISLLGANGKKSPDHTVREGTGWAIGGLGLYFGSGLFENTGLFYVILCSAGWLTIMYAGNYFSRIIWNKLPEDLFNRQHESFPQEHRLLQNPLSINIPAHYQYHGTMLPSWINCVSPQAGTIIVSASGGGKTAFILQHYIRQMIMKGYSMVLHDFKYDDLTRLTYTYFLRYRDRYPEGAGFYNIQFDDLDHSNRCNLLHPSILNDLSDAEEAARALLLGLNMEWIPKQGDFFVESAVTLVKALIWYLRRYNDGVYCSWPHVIQLAQTPKDRLFTVMREHAEITALVNPFIEAMEESAGEQLAGQLATVLIGLARLASPKLYYILTGNDYTLNVNDPVAPKIVCLGNDPQKAATYGPLVSAYLNAISRVANRKKGCPLGLVLEEFSTISVHTIDKTLATGRSNNIAVTLCFQSIDQLRLTYGEKFANTIFNACSNIFCGRVTGETAKLVSDRLGKTLQQRQSLTSTYADVQISDSHQLEPVVPESRIAGLSAGEFVGMMADTPDQPIALKAFCSQVSPDFGGLTEKDLKTLPELQKVKPEDVEANFQKIQAEIAAMVAKEYARISSTPGLKHFVIEKIRS